MGGKKGPEKNRKYEKDRRDRFNDQFNELNKLLPDFNSSMIKVTKAEIISRTIKFVKDTHSANQKFKDDFKHEKNKISELQKKVAGLLQIIKELIKLLHKSNINFPSSLPIDDFVSFKEAYIKCKRKLKESTEKENKKLKLSENEDEDTSILSSTESVDSEDENNKNSVVSTSSTVSCSNTEPSSAVVSEATVSVSTIQTTCNSQIMNLTSSNILHMNTNPLIIPQGNIVTVNGVPNAILNNINNPTILLNKQVTVPTLILMQNNIVPVSTVQPINTPQQIHKPIAPKLTVHTTKTTFINKKPIPAVRLYKSIIPATDGNSKLQSLKRKRIRRSKGILVKYPKRKPPSKNKKKEELMKNSVPEKTNPTNVDKTKPENMSSFSAIEPAASNSFTENSAEIGKNYSDNLFDASSIPNTGQFIDFFENAGKNASNNTDNINSSYLENANRNEKERGNEFERPFANTTVSCDSINSEVPKKSTKETESAVCEANKNLPYLPATSYIASTETIVNDENNVLDKRKCIEKDVSSLTIQCNLDGNKSVTKDLNLTFEDKSKQYETSFDEFSNDLFLHVPSSGQNTDSISPTAAFLSNFPLVSSFKNADLLQEHEEDSNATATNSTTILQIGNLGSPSTLLFTNKNSNRDGKAADKDENYAFCNSAPELENRDKKKDGKETTSRDLFNFDTFTNQIAKNNCSKDAVSQNIPFYPTSTSSSFPPYSMLTKYNDISAVTCSYYSFSSQPFPITKTSELVTDYNVWMPTYNQEEGNKEKKREKSAPVNFRDTFGLTETHSSEKAKSKKTKQNSSRTLVNWMTSPDSRNAPEILQPFSDIFSLTKDEVLVASTFPNNPNVQTNTNTISYSSADYFMDNHIYNDTQLSNKITYSSANPTSYSWSPSKTTLPTLASSTPNIMIPSTLPTLVGDLALGNNTSNSYDLISKKCDSEKKKSYQKAAPQNAGSFLSVTQLVDDKACGKSLSKKSNELYHYEDNRDKCCKENYNNVNKSVESTDYKRTYMPNTCKETPKNQIKCRKETVKCNMNNSVNRCVSKENKKDNRVSQKIYEYAGQSCQMASKEMNPLSNKNSNYSAESLIGSNNHSNACSSQNYFAYDNSSTYNNCATNKKPDDTDSLANVGYYANTNYMYANNFQTFNNYGFSNQYCNNYTSQAEHTNFQKKKDEHQQSKQDAEWYRESFSSYNSIVPSEFGNQQKEKCKQAFSNKYNCGQKNIPTSTHSGMYNSYYQYGSSSSASTALNHSKSSCNFNSSYPASQAGQHCSINNYQTPGYDMKLNRNSASTSTNTSNVLPATTLTNFNLSTIIPEINDKQCLQNRVNVSSIKNDAKYGAGNEINYNYLIQPTADTNSEPSTVYGSFPISHYPDFTTRRNYK